MATAKKLPSGSWRVQVSLGKDPVTGKRIVQSVTAPTKREAEYEAMQLQMRHKSVQRDPKSVTLGDAIDAYIASYDGVLSPSTVKGYRSIRRNRMQELMPRRLRDLDRRTIQSVISQEARGLSAKTVKNVYALLTATLREQHPDLYAELRDRPIKLPHAQPKEQRALEPEEIRILLHAIRGRPVEIPVLLALWLCMSRSEIAGLRWDHVDFDRHTLRVDQARVFADGGGQVIKGTKTRFRVRTLTIPPYVEEKLITAKKVSTSELVVPTDPSRMYKNLQRVLEREGLPKIRFHDLRHSAASVMLALNVPSYYAQRRGGWATDNMLRNVYGHQLEASRNEFTDLIDNFYDALTKDDDV